VKYLLRKCNVKRLVLPSRRNNERRTVFHQCCIHGYFESLMHILSACVALKDMTDVAISDLLNDKDASSRTALMLAVQNRRHEIVRFLSTCKSVNVDEQDSDGNTALHFAIKLKDMESINLLTVNGGASTRIRNKQKVSCHQLARVHQIQLPPPSSGHRDPLDQEENCDKMSFLQLMKEEYLIHETLDVKKSRDSLSNGNDSTGKDHNSNIMPNHRLIIKRLYMGKFKKLFQNKNNNSRAK